LHDGRVEIEVTGPEQTLDAYCEVLKQGPAFSQVREVVITSIDHNVESQGFEIKPDPELK
jgi:acylphosphatase